MKRLIIILIVLVSSTLSGQTKEKKELRISNFENFDLSIFNLDNSNKKRSKKTVSINVLGIGMEKYEGEKESRISGILERELNTALSFYLEKQGEIHKYYFPININKFNHKYYSEKIFRYQSDPLKLNFYITIYQKGNEKIAIIDCVKLKD